MIDDYFTSVGIIAIVNYNDKFKQIEKPIKKNN